MAAKLNLIGCALVAVIFTSLGTGCASIVNGTHQDIPVSSNPTGAAVLTDGVREGSTPMTVKLARNKTHVITLNLEGYETENISLSRSMSGAVAGNILAGGLIGWGVDATNGSQYKLTPDVINVNLRAIPPPSVAPSPDRSVDELLNELAHLDELRKSGKVSETEYSSLRAAVLAKYSAKK